MKHKIFIAAMAIAALLVPVEINAKEKSASVPFLKDANGVTIGRVIGMETVDGNLECVPFVFPEYSGYPAYPNDPNVAGDDMLNRNSRALYSFITTPS